MAGGQSEAARARVDFNVLCLLKFCQTGSERARNRRPTNYGYIVLMKTGRMHAMHQRVGSQGVSDRRHLH